MKKVLISLVAGPILIILVLQYGTQLAHYAMDNGWISDTRWVVIDEDIGLERWVDHVQEIWSMGGNRKQVGRFDTYYRINFEGVPKTRFFSEDAAKDLYYEIYPKPESKAEENWGNKRCLIDVRDSSGKLVAQKYVVCENEEIKDNKI